MEQSASQSDESAAENYMHDEEPSTSGPQGWEPAAKPKRPSQPKKQGVLETPAQVLKPLIRTTQERLSSMAAKQGELAALQRSIALLAHVVTAAMSTPRPAVCQADVDRRKARALAKRLRNPRLALQLQLRQQRQQRQRRRARMQQAVQKPALPAKPYAPYRWPPLRVTAAALKGGQAPATAAPSNTSPDHPESAAQSHTVGGGGSLPLRLGSEELDELLQVADEFEDKLHLGRTKRNSAGAGSAPKGKKDATGGLVLRATHEADGDGVAIRIQRPAGCSKRGHGREHPNYHRRSDKPEAGLYS